MERAKLASRSESADYPSMGIDELETIVDPLERAVAAMAASKRANRIRDESVREMYGDGTGMSYRAIAAAVGISKSLVAIVCKRGL